jgi:NlpC/P60 family putative phage cell wall peptidase
MTLHALPRDCILAEARAWIGTPYRHQASLIGVGCDCLGLVRGIWRALIGPEPRALSPYAPDWALSVKEEWLAEMAAAHLVTIPLDAARPGDVLLFRWRHGLPASHAAILSQDGQMIHAHDGAAVAEVAVTQWWRRHQAFAFSFPNAIG